MTPAIALPGFLESVTMIDDEPGARPSVREYHQRIKALEARLYEARDAGVPVVELVTGRAAAIDRLLIQAWEHFGIAPQAAALVAVGGYGRGELHPGSDIDLLLLLGAPPPPTDEERLIAFITFLWDIGLDVGHSVRTLDECVTEATADITVMTNLIESRPLAGSRALYAQLAERTAPERIWPSPAYFQAKLDEQVDRHRKFGDTAYKVEPNLKESPGGLRDIQMIGWVTRRHFGTGALHELVQHRFLNETEYQSLIDGQDFLWEVRFSLHQLAGRKEDRLLFDYQRELARRFGYADQDQNLAVEQFMQRYYRTVMELERLNEILLQYFQETILLAEESGEAVILTRRFQSRRGFLEARDNQIFLRYPPALLEVFLVLQQHPELKGVRASTIRLIRSHLHLIDDSFRNNLVCRRLFMEILRQSSGITRQLRRMNRYGVLAAYLPIFENIVGRMQYDLYHAYTVDEHTLMVLRNIRRLSVPEHAGELPLCSELFTTLPKPELLYLAGLFHDIAKGRGGDHSELGAEEAYAFCRHHGLGEQDAELVSWLVRNHLVMSMTAQRKDISSPEVIHEFATLVGNKTRLDYLFLLTVSDVRGTNPELWNSWKDALFTELYHSTVRVLGRGLDNPIGRTELVDEVRHEAAGLLAQAGLPDERIAAIWDDLDEDYFLRHTGAEVAWHTQAIAETGQADLPKVVLRQIEELGSTEIFLFSKDYPQLFALTTAALDQLGLNIVDARFNLTHSGCSLYTFLVLEANGKPITNGYRLQEIEHELAKLLDNPHQLPAMQPRRMPRKLKHFDVPTRIDFHQDPDERWTVMELSTADRPGLLARVSRALIDSGIKVQGARIATVSETADDVFYVTDMQHRPILSAERQQRVREAIEAELA
ncbi:MAG TPA: [protein-PII] uridylyltransferase [Thioalkalivibrio sp.]|nr:[protein-PII] uridylyltransferase [Thioalkalivibrio sp.]